MTLRFRIAQMLLVIALVAGLAATIYARDDDPRDFSRKYDSRSNTRVVESKRYDDRDDDGDDDSRRRRDRDDDDDDDKDDDDDRDHHQNHGNKKVTICHKEDNRPGGKTITISWKALAAHQLHGDTIGPCPVSRCK